ncbi:hypothetical protein Tco_0336474 [Tanacetum coccineum]
MDVKSAFLYGKIEEEVYVCQPPDIGMKTKSTYLLENRFQRGQIDKTLFIKRDQGDILIVQCQEADLLLIPQPEAELCRSCFQLIWSSALDSKSIALIMVDETQGRYGDDLMFDRGVLDDEEVFAGHDMAEKEINVAEKEVSTADPFTTAGEVVTTARVEVSVARETLVSTATTITTTAIIEVDLTLAQALAKLRSAKPKVVIQELVQCTTITTPSIIPKAKSITFRDPDKSTTRTTLTPIPSNIKDKVKAKMIELEKPLKKKEQIRLDKELAFKL